MTAQDNDSYAWLEDVHGAKPLSWVADQNKKSLGVLRADPRYQKDYDNILLSCVNYYDRNALHRALAGGTLNFEILGVFDSKSLAIFVVRKR